LLNNPRHFSFIIDDCRSLRSEQILARTDLHFDDHDYDAKKKLL
jgi:hypothetical protein